MSDSVNPAIPKPGLSVYFNASRLRTDTWNELKSYARRLEELARKGGDTSSLQAHLAELLDRLEPLEIYWAYPGRDIFPEMRRLLLRGAYESLARAAARIVRLLVSDAYRARAHLPGTPTLHDELFGEPGGETETDYPSEFSDSRVRPYFEVLVVDTMSDHESRDFRQRLKSLRRNHDDFVYDVVVVPSFEDALIAVLLNYNLQSCVIRYGFPISSANQLDLLRRFIVNLDQRLLDPIDDSELGLLLGSAIKRLRPNLDLFLVSDAPVEDIAGRLGRSFRRVFYRHEDYLELHLSILKGISERYQTPFFNALKNYSHKPTGVFHALPISRSKSISKSHWIKDMAEFYGPNVFLAETSATGGGLNSLSQPHGPLKHAQELAARAFGARRCFFVTNGTSTANKIVMQAVIKPGDIVLVSHDCHKSHHYALMLSGAQPVYLDPYPLKDYSMYGGVPTEEIKRQLLALKAAGKLHRVRMLLLTNCTFDGITYNTERVMEEVLAIKPDMIFVWDEAWYAFAYFTPITRRRTAMDSANRLRDRLRSPGCRDHYASWRDANAANLANDEWLTKTRLLPDPEQAKVRVYATQSTHKTLTSLRQGSMILVNDQDFEQRMREAFQEAYLTHTSTSPNYQILASLDVGRRQVELEGYELVQHAIELAVTLRERIGSHPLLRKFFQVLGPRHVVPREYRPSEFMHYKDIRTDWTRMDQAWESDEFCLDPTRITLHIGRTGIDGETFRARLIERHDIQINKTSRNTVLFMTHIGTTRGAVAYLIEVLTLIAQELEEELEDEDHLEGNKRRARISSLTDELPALPNFSRFHDAFRNDPNSTTSEGDLRAAFFAASEEGNVTYLRMEECMRRTLAGELELVSAAFVTPYPPGFPILVPGQVLSEEILVFLRALEAGEIHGYKAQVGLRVFTESALAAQAARRATTLIGANGSRDASSNGSNGTTEHASTDYGVNSQQQ